MRDKEKKKAKDKQRYMANREKISARIKADRLINPEKYRRPYVKPPKRRRLNVYMKYAYGISLAEYEKLPELQKHCCAICGTHKDNSIHRRLYVDHDHKTNKIRGLLCSQCNMGLGHFRDDLVLLACAQEYLGRQT